MGVLIIARHGNTFEPNEIPRRIGKRTDLPLTASGLEQAHRLGQYLKNHNLYPDMIITSTLQRTKQMATIIALYIQSDFDLIEDSRFDEIDYGVDENKTEDEVIARLGTQAIEAWNDHGILPQGWHADIDRINRSWRKLAEQSRTKTILVITSNGIARFAPLLTGDEINFRKKNTIKMVTGALSLFTPNPSSDYFTCELWNFRPS
jgi:probable phosphoglycerate mutase